MPGMLPDKGTMRVCARVRHVWPAIGTAIMEGTPFNFDDDGDGPKKGGRRGGVDSIKGSATSAHPQQAIERTVLAQVLPRLANRANRMKSAPVARNGTAKPGEIGLSKFTAVVDDQTSERLDGNGLPTSIPPILSDKTRMILIGAITREDETLFTTTLAQELTEKANDTAHASLPADLALAGALTEISQDLGIRWERDRLHFSDLTCLYGTLLRWSHRLISSLSTPKSHNWLAPSQHRALVLTQASASHNYGALLFADLLRNRGWHIKSLSLNVSREAETLLRVQPYDFVGISIGCNDDIGQWRSTVARVRAAATNPRLKVIVGGMGLAGISNPISTLDADMAFYSAGDALMAIEEFFGAPFQEQQADQPQLADC